MALEHPMCLIAPLLVVLVRVGSGGEDCLGQASCSSPLPGRIRLELTRTIAGAVPQRQTRNWGAYQMHTLQYFGQDRRCKVVGPLSSLEANRPVPPSIGN